MADRSVIPHNVAYVPKRVLESILQPNSSMGEFKKGNRCSNTEHSGYHVLYTGLRGDV